MTKRIFSLFLAMLLLVTSVPMQGFAAEAETIAEATEDVMEMTSSGDDYMFLEDLTMSFGAVPGATEETAAETTEATVETTEAAVETTVAAEVTAEATEEATQATEETTEATEETTEVTEPVEFSTAVAPEGYVSRSWEPEEELDLETTAVKFPNRRVLLIEDNLPWKSDANHQVLRNLAVYDKVSASNLGKTDVSKYDVIILANDQGTSSYTTYARFADKIEEFAEQGGVIVFGACDEGWEGGYMGDVIPGGIKKANRYTSNNQIVDGTHPIVIGQLTDNRTLTNGHLYGNYCSHTYFMESTFPVGTRVILREVGGHPTLIEYPLGNGRVIASGLTWEHNYVNTRSFAPIAMDDLYNYALYVSGQGNKDLGHLMHNKLKDSEHMVIVADSKTKDPISGAEVTFGGKKYTTDKDGQVRIENVSAGRTTVTVKKSGYQTKTIRSKIAGGDMEYIFLDTRSGSGAYLTGADVKVTGGKNGTKEYDLTLENVDIRKESTYTVTLHGDWGNQKAGKYMLYIGGQCAYSTNGVFTFKNGKCSNSSGSEVEFSDGKFHARMVSSDGKQSKAMELNLYSPKKSEGSVLEDSDLLFSVGGSDGIKIGIPKDMPVVGGMEFQVKLDDIPVCAEVKEDSIKIAIGINKLKDEHDPEKAMADWEKKWEAVDRTANLKEVMKAFGAKSGGFTLKRGWEEPDLNIIGYAEGKFDKATGKISEITGGFIVSVDFMYRYNQQFVVGPVPVYFEIGGGVEIQDEGKVQGILMDAKQLILDNELTVTPKFSIGGGVGINGALSVGAEGTAKLPIVLCKSTWNPTDKTFDVYTNVSLSGEMDLTASLLFVFNARHSIAKGTWQILRYYWDTGEIEYFEAGDLAAQSVTDFSDTGSFSLMDRSYLRQASDWYTDSLSTAAFQDGMTVLQTGVMPTSDPQIVTCEDGTAIMVFQSDIASRSSLNRSCLMYSVYSNGIWSAPQRVWDNGCADMAASLATGDAGTYVVWQKLDEVLADSTSVDQVAAHVEIAAAAFDPATGTFVDARYLTDDSQLQMLPAAAVGTKDAYAHYVTNSSNALLGGGTNEIVRTSLTADDSDVLYTTDAYVTCLTASADSRGVNTAYILDEDSDMETVEDTQLYINGKAIHDGDGAQLNAQYHDGILYWFEDAEQTIYTYSGGRAVPLLEPDSSIGTNFQIMSNEDGKFAIVWLGTTTDDEDCVYAKIRRNGTWSAPVELVTSDATLLQLAGYLDEQGKWELVALSKEGENSSNLLYSGVTPYLTTTAANISYIPRNRDDQYPQILTTFTNGSENTLDHLTVDVVDAAGTKIHSQNVACSILGGETQQLVLDIDLPTPTEVTEYTVLIYPEGEENLLDNQGTISVGYSDLALLLSTRRDGSSTMVNIRVYNDSDLPSDASLIVREGNAETGIIMDIRSLGQLNAGETYNYTYTYDLTKMDFQGQETKVYHFQVTGTAAESTMSNNSSPVTFRNPQFAVMETPTGIYANVPEPVELNLDSNRTYQLEATTEPAASAGWTLLYSSSDPAIATVDADGMIHAVREGTATITVTAENTDVTREIAVLVNPPAAKRLTLVLTELGTPTTGYQMNDQYQLAVYGEGDAPMDNSLFDFVSSKNSLADISSDGVVTLLAKGSAKVDAVYRDNPKLKASATLKITEELAGSVNLHYQQKDTVYSGEVLETKTQELKDAPIQLIPEAFNERGARMENVDFAYKSNNTAVAKVDRNGLITGTGKEGVAVISAAPKGSAASAELALYVCNTGAPLLIADTNVALNTYLTPNHPDAPVIQLQTLRNGYLTVSNYLYQKDKDGSYIQTQIRAVSGIENAYGLHTLKLGCDSNPGTLKSGEYYLHVYADGEPYYIPLKLKISGKAPTIKVSAQSLNAFFTDQTSDLQIATDETIQNVWLEEILPAEGKVTNAFSLTYRYVNGLPQYSLLPTSTLISALSSGKSMKDVNLKYNLHITLDHCNSTIIKPLTVPAVCKAPTVKLDKTTVFASSNGYVTAELRVSAAVGRDILTFGYAPSCHFDFPDYMPYVQSRYQDGTLLVQFPALASGSLKGTMYIQDSYNWIMPVPVKLTISAKNLAKDCKISPITVDLITGQEVSQPVLLGGKQPLALSYSSLVYDDLFYICSDSSGLRVTPLAPVKAYGSKYQYNVTLITTSGETIENVPITIRTSKTAPKITAPSKLYLNGSYRGRSITAALSSTLNWNLVNPELTSVVVKKGAKVSGDLSAVYSGNGIITITTQQNCSGNYTVEVTPVLYNGEKLKTVKLQVSCVSNATVTATVKNELDYRDYLNSRTAVSLKLKNTSAQVENISIVGGFASMFEIRETHLSCKDPLVYIGLKDQWEIVGGTHPIALELTFRDGSTMTANTSIKVICSDLSVSLPVMITGQNAKSLTVMKAFNPKLPANTTVLDIRNADNASPFQVSYNNGVIIVTAQKKAGIRKGIFTVDCFLRSSTDLPNDPGTPCKLKVIVR